MSRAIILFLALAPGAQMAAKSTPGSGAVTPAPPRSLPGWTVQTPDTIDWDDSGLFLDDWYVRIQDGHLAVGERLEEVTAKLPFTIKPIQRRGESDLAGRRHVVAVTDGYLVGFDAGEFGGGAWWFSTKGTRSQKLTLRASDTLADYYPENVHGFGVLGNDVLAFEGLTHMGSNVGRVVRLHRGSDGKWHASLFAQLGACPHAILQERPATWLVATTGGIFRIGEDAQVRPLWQPRGGHLYYPNSLVRDDGGVIYMGTRAFVVRVVPQASDRYLVDVLVPPKHRRFEPDRLMRTPGQP